jgi:HEAT repeat protein
MAHRAVLGAKAKAAPYLARVLAEEPSAYRRGEIVHALGHAGATKELVAALRDDDGFVRRRAALCLVALGDRSFATMREVIGCLEDDEDEPFPIDWAATAADALVSVGDEAVPLLEARLRKIVKPPVRKKQGEGIGTEEQTVPPEQKRIEAILARIRKKNG